MLKTAARAASSSLPPARKTDGIAVIWIDWYPYHVARFEGLLAHPDLEGRVSGIELVGGIGVHAGLKFREELPSALPIETLFPQNSWGEVKGWKAARALWRRLNRLDPAVVLVPGYYTAPGLAAALWGKLKRRRTVLMTESTESDHPRTSAKESVKSLLVRGLFDWAIAGGAPHRRYLERLGFPKERIARFYDVVDNTFFRERARALRKHALPSDFDLPERYFLYVGRLAEEKNVRGLLGAYFEYRRSGGNWALVLVGDGPERKTLEEMATASRYGAGVRFAGLRSASELPEFYAFAGCFVLPSTREPWGLVANEAMAAALPLIVSRRCGCAEDLLAEGENGCSFDPDLPGDLTACLTAVAGLEADSLADMGRRSEEIVARFSPAAWASEVARIARS
ncbi:MAG: glycosyltransferase [Acidobacteriota bacterium]|nr:glycosyltransferase [Acidobacteriota bacterium]